MTDGKLHRNEQGVAALIAQNGQRGQKKQKTNKHTLTKITHKSTYALTPKMSLTNVRLKLYFA